MKTRPLFGICPLFGVSVKREFTVYIIMILRLYRFITDYIVVYYMYTCIDKTMQIVLERGSIDT